MSSISELADLNPERWTRSTRNWAPVGAVILNPQGAPNRRARRDNSLDTHRRYKTLPM